MQNYNIISKFIVFVDEKRKKEKKIGRNHFVFM